MQMSMPFSISDVAEIATRDHIDLAEIHKLAKIVSDTIECDYYGIGIRSRESALPEITAHNFKNWDGIGTADMQSRDPVYQNSKSFSKIFWNRSIFDETETGDLYEVY